MTAAAFSELLPALSDEQLAALQASFDRVESARRDAELAEQELIGAMSLLEENN